MWYAWLRCPRDFVAIGPWKTSGFVERWCHHGRSYFILDGYDFSAYASIFKYTLLSGYTPFWGEGMLQGDGW